MHGLVSYRCLEELGRYAATELWLEPGRYVATKRDGRSARSLRSDRARRTLCSDRAWLGRYKLGLGRYVATERDGRSVAIDRARRDRAWLRLGRYVATKLCACLVAAYRSSLACPRSDFHTRACPRPIWIQALRKDIFTKITFRKNVYADFYRLSDIDSVVTDFDPNTVIRRVSADGILYGCRGKTTSCRLFFARCKLAGFSEAVRILAKRQILGSRIRVFDTMPRDVRDQCAGFRARPRFTFGLRIVRNKLNGKKYRFESSRRIFFEKMLVRMTDWSSMKVFLSRKEISSKN
ncbi:hypothetical protein IGI04_007059 [Brassica rapa subsp. trilocularis]|uniref:Uncharacterized protein n=1 Tax=Brassica rapa subsp. trilocularis TaxID=1813537 RepID=A0ABQ7NL18_BRACM|nr:hypothetical protein IGI04_007059 [Brassica rapa subsp. trilocularis]